VVGAARDAVAQARSNCASASGTAGSKVEGSSRLKMPVKVERSMRRCGLALNVSTRAGGA